VASGIPAPRWTFEGFLPRRGRERTARLARIAADERAAVLFEAPARTAATLRDLAAACGDDRRAALCRELTKRFEEIRRGSLAQLAQDAQARPPKGEVTLVVAGAGAAAARPAQVSLEEGRRQVHARVEAGLARSAAAREVAVETGLPRRDLFREDPENA
jgi:16S rRNA (cytidine1402-2'-O)-methyltransferase